MSNYEWIDDCFRIEKKKWGTWASFDKEGKEIITSLNEDNCITATRWYIQAKQDGFPEITAKYEGKVGGKL